MDASSSTSSSRFRPAAALWALAVIVLIESLVTVCHTPLAGALQAILDEKSRWLRDAGRADDILILGDSRYFSVRPETVANALGGDLTATNYSWPYMGIDAYDAVLNACLQYKDPPKYIVFSLAPEFLSAPPSRTSYHFSPELRVFLFSYLPPGALLPYLVENGEYAVLWDYLRYRATPPSTRLRDRILRPFRQAFRGEMPLGRRERGMRYRQQMDRHGAFRVFEGQQVANALAEYERRVDRVRLQPRPAALSRVRQFLDRAEEHGIRVLLLNMPLPESLCERYDLALVTREYEALIRGWEMKYPDFFVIGETLPCLPDDHFGDAGHVNLLGDLVFHRYATVELERYFRVYERRLPGPPILDAPVGERPSTDADADAETGELSIVPATPHGGAVTDATVTSATPARESLDR